MMLTTCQLSVFLINEEKNFPAVLTPGRDLTKMPKKGQNRLGRKIRCDTCDQVDLGALIPKMSFPTLCVASFSCYGVLKVKEYINWRNYFRIPWSENTDI